MARSLFHVLLLSYFVANALPPTAYTYQLSESGQGYTLWTAPTMRKVLKNDPLPGVISSGISLAAAKGEWESFQIIISGGGSNPTVSLKNFSGFGATQAHKIFYALYIAGLGTGNFPEELVPVVDGSAVTLVGGGNTIVWFDVYVPKDAPSGHSTTTVTLGPLTIPVDVYVFNFAMPDRTTFLSQANKGMNAGDQDELFDHKLSPTSVTYPSGPKYDITWTPKCGTFNDESATCACPFQMKCLADKYVHGNNWTSNPRGNGVGFPIWMLFQFVRNCQTRPASFCAASLDGAQLGGPDCTTGSSCASSTVNGAYNVAFGAYLTALQTWLATNNYPKDRTYIYVQNEPGSTADYHLAAALSRVYRNYAPNIRIAISEIPRPEIAEEANYGPSGYDIWIAEVVDYDKPAGGLTSPRMETLGYKTVAEYGNNRMKNNGEQVWLYSLPQDTRPYWNPSRSDYTGLHYRIIGWSAFKYRCRGWAYYDFSWTTSGRNAGGFYSQSNVPTLKTKILRDSFDDFDYLYKANGNAYPVPGTATSFEATLNSVAPTFTTWNSVDYDAMQHVRNDLGLRIEGTLNCVPVLVGTCTSTMTRKAYYLNFQDKAATYPAPLEARYTGPDGVLVWWTDIKFGSGAWTTMGPYGNLPGEDPQKGFISQDWGNAGVLLGAAPGAASTGSVGTIIYDDNGRTTVFNWCIPNGRYFVSITTGWFGSTKLDKSTIYLEGEELLYGVVPGGQVLVLNKTVDLLDCCLTVQFGVYNEYTFLASMDIVPVNGTGPAVCSTNGTVLPTAPPSPSPTTGTAYTCTWHVFGLGLSLFVGVLF